MNRRGLAVALALGCLSCSEGMSIALEATNAASAAFKEARDEERIQRDAAASRRLGELSVGANRLTVEELQPLKKAVQEAKADGKVTLEEADRILVEMERAAALRDPPKPRS